MKTSPLRLFAALAALCTFITLPAAELPVNAIPARIQVNGTHVNAGTGRVLVTLRLGSPNAVLPDGSWLYSGYAARRADNTLVANGTLIIRFQDDRVKALSIADRATIVALREAPRPPTQDTLLTAANDRR